MARLASVLVIRMSSLGDVVFAVPAVEALLASDVAERVAWLVEDRAASIPRALPGLHEVIVFPRRRRRAWPAYALALRRRRDDAVLDLQGNAKSRLHLGVLRAPRRIGFDVPIAKNGAHRALTEPHSPPRRARHRIASNLSLLAALGVAVPDRAPRPTLSLPPDAVAEARAWLGDGAGGGPLVVLHPGTSRFGEIKRWPPARFAAVGDRLAADLRARIVVTWGPGEEDLASAVVAAMSARARRGPPGSPLHLAGLLQGADLLVASDSLPLHLANALGTRVVGLYGAKDPAVTGPYWDRSAVVRSGAACSPCTLRRCRDRICMDGIAPSAVAAAAAGLLAS